MLRLSWNLCQWFTMLEVDQTMLAMFARITKHIGGIANDHVSHLKFFLANVETFVDHISHCSSSSTSICQCSMMPSLLKCSFFLNGSLPFVKRKTEAMHNKIPGCSFATSFPLLVPSKNLVFGKFWLLWRNEQLPHCMQRLSMSAKAEVGPDCSNEQSRAHLKKPSRSECSISMGHAPWTPCLLWNPNCKECIAFWMLCWDISFNACLSPALTRDDMCSCASSSQLGKTRSNFRVGTGQCWHNCWTKAIREVHLLHSFSPLSVSHFIKWSKWCKLNIFVNFFTTWQIPF